jgi:hypothetical protein
MIDVGRSRYIALLDTTIQLEGLSEVLEEGESSDYQR